MSGANSNGRREGASAPSVVRQRVRRLAPEEVAELPPVRTKSIWFSGLGTGAIGWRPWPEGEKPRTVVEHLEPTEDAPGALLDWALVSWDRRHEVEVVWDYSDEPSDDELPSDAEVLAIAREVGLEVIDDGPA